jgi:hypothetical protein
MEHNELITLFGKRRSKELDLAILPSFLQRYLELTTKHTDARPALLLTAFLPFCAVNIGNRAYMSNNSTRIYPNIWSCVIGPSSISRKTTALRFGSYTIRPYEELLQTAPLKEYEQQTLTITGTTLSKLMSYLAVNPSRLFVQNELSGWLHEMNKSYNAGYKQTVTELYDNVDRTIANRERTERIIKPALSIAAASTEGWLYKTMLDGAEQLGGFLQRMLFCVVRDINLEDIDLDAHPGNELETELAAFDTEYFQAWRKLPANTRLELSSEALLLRNELYQERYRQYFAYQNDALMSYFTRIYDGYFFKFCILFTLADVAHDANHADLTCSAPLARCATTVSSQTAEQAFLLCDFYMENTLPLLEIMDEQDKLAGERKLVEIIINKYKGKAKHSDLMNMSHMRKKEFRDSIESLIEREALTVETYQSANFHASKLYVLAPEILESWRNNEH